MNQKRLVPLASLTGGAVALILRSWNLRAGFDPSGLPYRGHPSFSALLIFLALLFVSLALSTLRFPADANPRFPFSAYGRPFRLLTVTGAFLLALSGAADFYESATGEHLFRRLQGASSVPYEYTGFIDGADVGLSSGVQCAAGVMALLIAWSALECVRSCLNGKPLRFRTLVLIPPVALSFRLVVVYRMDSVNPVLQDYAPALVALILHTLAFYHFSAFAFDCGSLRKFAASAGCASALSLCVLADGGDYVSTPLLLLGSAAVLTGFLFAALESPAVKSAAPPPA